MPGFRPHPTGPFEADPIVKDSETAHQHFISTHEIKFRQARRAPVTSYIDHYPGHEVEAKQPRLPSEAEQLPFTSDTEYQREFPWRDGTVRDPHNGNALPYSPLPFMGRTTYNHFHAGFPVDGKAPKPLYRPQDVDVDLPSFIRDANKTTNQITYVPHPVSRVPGPTRGVAAHLPLPWMAGRTTHQEDYPGKDLPFLALVPKHKIGRTPFDASTEYQDEYLPKEVRPAPPHLTGLVDSDGIPLPGPRKSLGVQYWHNGNPSKNYILLPHYVPAPCSAWQVFTTVHDNEDTGAIVIHYGEGDSTANTEVIGQLDLTGIPPAPRDVPRILVKFTLSADMRLKVEVRDLDTQRQKDWLQRGDIVLVNKGTAACR